MSEIVRKGGYGSRVAAYIGLFSSQYRQFYHQIERIMQAVFSLTMSLDMVKNLRTKASETVRGAVTGAQEYIQQ